MGIDPAQFKRPNLVVISDAGRDIDDEFALASMAHAHRQGHIQLNAVVANLLPSAERARLIKGTLNALGLPDIPVAAGMPVNDKINHTPFETMAAYKADASELFAGDGQQLLQRTLRMAEDHSVALLLISGLSDADVFVREHSELAQRKISRVVIMGGARTLEDGTLSLDAQRHVRPDDSYNNACDPAAAQSLYTQLQQLHIPMTLLCRHAVYPAALEHRFFEEVLATGSAVGKRIQMRHKEFITDFWRIVNLAADHPARIDFPPRMDRKWFIEKFTHNTDDVTRLLQGGAPVYDHIKHVNMYDVMALMAAIAPHAGFQPHRHGDVEIIGLSEKEHGIADAAAIRRAMREGILQGLAFSKSTSRAL